MGVFGSIMKVVMIVLVSILAVFVVLGLILLLFPTVSIFGIHYVSTNYEEASAERLRGNTTETQAMWDGADKYLIQTGGYDVVVRMENLGQTGDAIADGMVITSIKSFYKGFVWGGDAYSPTYSSSVTEGYIYDNGQKVFFVKMAEPGGMLIRSETVLTIIIADGSQDIFAEKPLEIVTKTGKITIGGDLSADREKVSLKDLNISSTSGTVELKNISVADNLEVEKTSGDIITNTNFDCTTKLSILGGYGIIELKDITSSGKLEISTTNTHTTVGNIYGDFQFKADGGLLETGDISQNVDLELGSCDCKLGKIGGYLNVTGGDGYVTSPSVNGTVTLNINNGSVTLDNTESTVKFESQKGSLTLKNAKAEVTTQTEYGTVDITCDQSSSFPLNITTTHGAVKFTGAKENVSVEVKNKGTANINGTFTSVTGTNTIVGFAGNIELYVPRNAWKLKWQNLSGKTSINIGSIITDKKTSSEYLSGAGWVNIIEGEESTNTLSVTNSSGQVTISQSTAN